mgnify:CR=1 FL=1
MNKKYKHLFFDLDHTLWDFETNSEETLKELFETFKLIKYFDNFDDIRVTHPQLLFALWC